MDLRDRVELLRRYFPDLDVREEPWPHVMLDDAAVELMGELGRRWWMRATTPRVEELVDAVPGAVRIGLHEIAWPLYGAGQGGANRIKTLCPRGHSLLDPENVYKRFGRRYCRSCR